MSSTTHTPRDVTTLLRSTGSHMSGKKRGPDRRVRRHSYDVDDPRALIFRRVGDGTKRGGGIWKRTLVRVAEEFDRHERARMRAKGVARKQGPLGLVALQVLRVLVDLVDHRTGQLDPCLETIAARANVCRGAVIRALARLRAHGFLLWVRRTLPTGAKGEAGPQRKQTSNAYVLHNAAAMASHVAQRFRDMLNRTPPATAQPEARPRTHESAPPAEFVDVLAKLKAGAARQSESPSASA